MGKVVTRKMHQAGLIICILFFFIAGAVAAETTNGAKATNEQPAEAQQTLRAYLQLQEQLHAATLAIEQTRQEATDAANRNAEMIATRLKLIEQTLALQREREAEAIQKSNRFILIIACVFGGVGLLAMVFTALFLLRAMNRLAEIAATFPLGHALGAGLSPAALGGGQTHLVGPPQEGTKLLGAIERLEKRIHELETVPQLAPASEQGHQPSNGEPKTPDADSRSATAASSVLAEKQDKVSLMLGKGQALLNLDQPENAMGCFDEVLSLEPAHAEALVKKGTALERLKRWEEALDCYDRAIAANGSMTLAYLHKGGVFNQLERFSEALQCYEQALRTQQKPAKPGVS